MNTHKQPVTSVSDSVLRDCLRAVTAESEKLCGRVDALEVENRLLRFEFNALVAGIDPYLVRPILNRRATLHSELGLFAEQDEIGLDGRGANTMCSRVEILEERIQILEKVAVSSERDVSNGELGALIFTKCLSCQAPGSSNRRPESPPLDPYRIQHGRPLGQKTGNARLPSGRPSSAPLNGFRFDAVRPYLELQDLAAEQQGLRLQQQQQQQQPRRSQNTTDSAMIRVGRRAGAFGVEKIRPRPRPRHPFSQNGL